MIVKDLRNSFNPVPKTTQKSGQKSTESTVKSGLKKKSSKLAKLEKNRFSILTTNMEKCYLCNKKKKHIHEIYKGSNRQTSIKNGFCIPICEECHLETEINSKLDKDLKIKCQEKFEETHFRKDFIALIGKSYIKEICK